MSDEKKVVVILPAYNLETSIGDIVRRVKKHIQDVIVVADGSNDQTAKAAKDAGAIVPDAENTRGKGFAVIKGFELSKQYNPDVVILMDSDGQHLPEEIPVMLKPFSEDDYDMVIGSRMMGTLRTSTINKFGNFGLKIISFLVTGVWMTDTESGFRAFKSSSLYKLNLEAISYEIESELLLKSLHNKFKLKEVPITIPFAVPGVTVWDGFKVGWYKIRVGLGLKFSKLRGR